MGARGWDGKAQFAGGWFFYDTDEFLNVAPAFAASNPAHDASHGWLDHKHKLRTGNEAESACRQLQVVNQAPLGVLRP